MKFKKTMGKVEVTTLALGSIIGSGAFILPGDLFLKELGFFNMFIGLILGAISILIIEKNYGYLIHKFPSAGGEYVFVKNSLGKMHAFICGWFLLLAYISIVPLNATALSVGINTIFDNSLHIGYMYSIAGYEVYLAEVIVAIFALLIFAWFNIKNVKIAVQVQNVMVFLLVGIILFFTSTLLITQGLDSQYVISHLDLSIIDMDKILKTMIIAPFLFVGFDCIPQVAEELKFEAKQASLLAMLAIVIGAILYIALTFATSFGVTTEMLQSGSIDWATGYTVEKFFGYTGLIFIGIAFLTAIVAGINGFYLASSRLIVAMARDGDLPELFTRLDKKNHTPTYAILAILILALIAPFLGRRVLLWIVDMSSIGAVFAYLYTSIASMLLYKKEFNRINPWSIGGIVVSIGFIMLMLLPIFTTSLVRESYIAFITWTSIGFIILLKKFYL